MSASCCGHDLPRPDPHRGNESYRRVLWAVLAINAVMFAVEVVAGFAAGSASLQADALDFLGDAGNYAISLFVVGMALRYRARRRVKGATMGVFGLWVLGVDRRGTLGTGRFPAAFTMGAVGSAALPPMRRRSASSGPTEAATRTCARPGFAPATTCSAIWRCCLRARRVRHRHRLARRDRGRHHGGAGATRGVRRAQPIAGRASLTGHYGGIARPLRRAFLLRQRDSTGSTSWVFRQRH